MSRFHEPQHPDFARMNTSLGFDRRLWPQDIAGSRAHAKMLAARGIISEDDLDALLQGLEQVRRELEEGSFRFVELAEPVGRDEDIAGGARDVGGRARDVGGRAQDIGREEDRVQGGGPAPDEDIHMAIERRLIEIVGPVGGKLHTARSRNDQVATDLSLYTRERAQVAGELIVRLMTALLERAEQHLDWPLPGYTHLQRAQPVYLSHHLLAYFWMLTRDRERFAFAERQCSRLPLGAGALAGVNFDTDRELVARELGFAQPVPNSIDAVSNRDFALDYLSAVATCATHLSRLGAELVLWSSAEFGFCELPDAWSSGSSIMPQKKNPDAAELLRAKAPRVVSHLSGLHGVMHALPLTYNKDLQEDKEHLFDAADTIELALAAARGMIAGAVFDRERLAAAAGDEMIAATDVADLLVRRGMPFREAHGVVAALVRAAVDNGRELSELTPNELAEQSELLGDGEAAEEYYKVLARYSWLESKISMGGTSLARVREQLELARTVLADEARG
jgi:argininosuccinate lyase